MDEEVRWSALGRVLLADRASRNKGLRGQYALPGGPAPEGVIFISDAAGLVSVVRWARENGVPLVPSSSAPPHFHAGLSMPDGAYVVDFSRMKKVVKVNRRNRVALFEAGVSFEELIPQAGAEGLRVMVPLLPRPGKSALAAYLDREPTIYPKYQWDISDPLLCVEAVYGTGDLFRTGSAAGPGTVEEQWAAGEYQKSPMGPGQNDWMKLIQGAQGGIGLVTWCSAKCEVKPKAEALFVAGADRLEPLVRASHALFHQKITDMHFIVDAETLACMAARSPGELEAARPRAWPWNLVYTVSGIEHFAEKRRDYFARQAEEILLARGAGLSDPPLISQEELLKKLARPNQLSVDEKNRLLAGGTPVPHFRDLARGAHGRVYFQTTLDRADGFAALFQKLMGEAGLEAERLGRYVQPQLGGRCCHIDFTVAADGGDPKDLARVREFCGLAAGPLIKAGAFFSRPHGEWAAPAMEKAASSRHVFEKVKSIFDPDGVLAPGRLTLGGERHA